MSDDDTGDVTVTEGDVTLPLWQIRALADAAKVVAGTTMDHRKVAYAQGVEDALRLISGQMDHVPSPHAIRPIYDLYLEGV